MIRTETLDSGLTQQLSRTVEEIEAAIERLTPILTSRDRKRAVNAYLNEPRP